MGKLHDLIETEMKSGGLLDDPCSRSCLLSVLQSRHQAAEFYHERFEYWTDIAQREKEKRRSIASRKLRHFITFESRSGKVLSDLNMKLELDTLMNWDDGSNEEYTAKLEMLRTEKERRETRKKLFDFIDAEMKPGGLLDESELLKDLNTLKTCMDYRTEAYIALLQEWTEEANRVKEIRRQRAFEELRDFIKVEIQPGNLLDDPSLKSALAEVEINGPRTLQEYTEELVKWKKCAKSESSRRQARQKLQDFIVKETKHGGALDNPKVADLLKELMAKQNVSTDEYDSELRKWKTYMKKAKEAQRIKARQKLKKFIFSIDGAVFEGQKSRDEIIAWNDGSAEEYSVELEKWEKLVERFKAKKALNDDVRISTRQGSSLEDLKAHPGLWIVATWHDGSNGLPERELQRSSHNVDDETELRQLDESCADKSSPNQNFENTPEFVNTTTLSNLTIATNRDPFVYTSTLETESIKLLDAAEKKKKRKVEINGIA